MDVTLFFFNSSPDFGNHNSFFFFLSFSATWLPQFIFSLSSIPYNFGNLVATIGKPFKHSPQHALGHFTRALHGQEQGRTRISVISLPKFIFSPSHHITHLSSLSYFFLQFWQHHCRNSVSLLILLNNFEQYL